MPSYLPGIFVMVAGIAMITFRRPLSLLQSAAIGTVRPNRGSVKEVSQVLQKIIVGGGILFVLFGAYLFFNPISS